jgi:hypothetical protein
MKKKREKTIAVLQHEVDEKWEKEGKMGPKLEMSY